MAKVALLNQLGEKVNDIELDETVFAVDFNNHTQVVYDVVNAQRAGMRQGTHDTKNRTEVSGGGRKPWRQKGTGRARQGSIRAPQWRGGGTVFGPTPRSYAVKTNRKVVKLAVRCLLSDRFATNNLLVVDSINVAVKTKEVAKIMSDLKVNGKTLVITEEENLSLELASRNIPNIYVQTRSHVSVYDLINADNYVLTQDAVEGYTSSLSTKEVK